MSKGQLAMIAAKGLPLETNGRPSNADRGVTRAAKAEVGHGNWLDWIDREFGWSEATAKRYMQVASAFKSLSVSDFDGLTIDATALYATSCSIVRLCRAVSSRGNGRRVA
jgi:Protein of unknown function (DUF3102)